MGAGGRCLPVAINIRFLCSLNAKSGGLNEKVEVLLRKSSWLNIGQVDGQWKNLEWESVINHTHKASWVSQLGSRREGRIQSVGWWIKELLIIQWVSCFPWRAGVYRKVFISKTGSKNSLDSNVEGERTWQQDALKKSLDPN